MLDYDVASNWQALSRGGLFIAAQKEAILLFACVVIFSGYRLAINGAPEDMLGDSRSGQPVEGNSIICAMQSVVPVTDYYDGVKFVTSNPLDGATKLTPLFLVLLIIEATDLMFALDNVPALFSIVPSVTPHSGSIRLSPHLSALVYCGYSRLAPT